MDNLISIIMPTYSRSNYIVEAIDSIFSQTYQNFELIIVDDNGAGSENQLATEKRINRILMDNRVKYIINEKNQGGSVSRNIGAQHASGTYLTFLDDDDLYVPTKLEKQVNFMIENELDLCFVDDIVYDESGREIERVSRKYDFEINKTNLLKEHLLHHITGTNDMMFKKAFFDEIGAFDDIESGQEFFLTLKALVHNCRIGFLNDYLVHYRVHNNGRISTNIKKIKGQQKLIEAKRQYYDVLTNSEIRYVECRNDVVCAYVYSKNRMYLKMIVHLFKGFFVSPKSFVQIVKTKL